MEPTSIAITIFCFTWFINQHFEYRPINPISPHRLICIQLQHQISHKLRAGWNLSLLQSQSSNWELQWSQSPPSALKTEATKALNISAVSTSLLQSHPSWWNITAPLYLSSLCFVLPVFGEEMAQDVSTAAGNVHQGALFSQAQARGHRQH